MRDLRFAAYVIVFGYGPGRSIIIGMGLEQQIKDKARELGFDAVGITDAAPIEPAQVERFHTWLDSGHAGQMDYMRRNVEKRLSPGALLVGAQSVVVVALNYKPLVGAGPCACPGQPQGVAPTGPVGRVAQYACYEDYHDFMKPLLHELAVFMRERTAKAMRFKVCVDSVPLAERALALRAGLGFIGRSHTLIHPTLGPQVLLGEIVTSALLRTDEDARCCVSTASTCAGCDRCVRACPTAALRADGRFDANRCISYLTIEHRGAIDPELAARIGDRLFGCDECVLACPYRDAAPSCANERFRFYPDRQRVHLQRILEMAPESFEAEFAGSPIYRLGIERLKRNARICIQNLNR
ncbi:MAG: tRNA epoxyqueuosine(34) reductase QueG [Sedimentisphaerales bacterium]|nr:tRNA epoxyqueuosine(34) reductase QueG [Sedimentisphaerales bacterium]